MNSVQVIFDDLKHNYSTSLSAKATQLDAESYFIGQTFNVGSYPHDDFQTCIAINYNNNEVTA